VAKSDRIRALLGWQPQFDDLTTIARHALAWERKLAQRRSDTAIAAAASA
jgi:UDP-glucose 4-epimerase